MFRKSLGNPLLLAKSGPSSSVLPEQEDPQAAATSSREAMGVTAAQAKWSTRAGLLPPRFSEALEGREADRLQRLLLDEGAPALPIHSATPFTEVCRLRQVSRPVSLVRPTEDLAESAISPHLSTDFRET